MYSEDDINSAVAAGALSKEAASSFRDYMSKVREIPRSSEENFKLINSFNDVFVAIGIVIMLLAVGAIGQQLASLFLTPPIRPDFTGGAVSQAQLDAFNEANGPFEALQTALGATFVALAAWPLAEFFTRKRRMALPSILLLLGFVGGVFGAVFGFGAVLGMTGNEEAGAFGVLFAGLFAAGAAYAHWRRFMVPITVAAGAGVLTISVLIALLAVAQMDADNPAFLIPVLIGGIGVFALAMRWDMGDLTRTTRRSDVAFWLHLLAAPMIAHPIFALIGVTGGDNIGIGAAIGVLLVYCGFGLLALAIDRRALLVSALAYVLFALGALFQEFGAVEFTFALTALVIGSALLSLSAFWQPIRKAVVSALPQDLQARLPVANLPEQAGTPAADLPTTA